MLQEASLTLIEKWSKRSNRLAICIAGCKLGNTAISDRGNLSKDNSVSINDKSSG